MHYRRSDHHRLTKAVVHLALLVSPLPILADALQLEEIIVTAQKREQDLQEVPISISAFTEKDLTTIGVAGDDIRALAARVPNLNVESTFGRVYPRFYIRGLGNADFTMTATQPVALYYDEIALENPILKGMPAFDLQQVEVLRGPQGTLWGKNTPAGALHLISKRPAAEVEGYGRLTLGRYDTRNLEGAVGGAIVEDSLSGRLSFLSQSRDGWVRNTATGNDLDDYDDLAWRAQLLWEPAGEFSTLARVHARHLDGTSTLFNAGDRKDEIALTSDDSNRQEVDQFGGSLKLEYDFADMTLTSITALETGELDTTGNLAGTDQRLQYARSRINDLDQLSQEIRLASSAEGGFNWQVGAYFFDEEIAYDETSSNTTDFGFFLDAEQETRSWAVFGQAAFAIGDALTLTAGIRYTDEDKALSQSTFFFGPDPTDNLNPFAPGLIFGGPGSAVPDAVDDSWSEVTGDLSLSYRLSDTVNLYTRLAKGFRAGTINGFAVFDPLSTVDPETVVSLEAGFKSDLVDNRLRLNVSVFAYDFQDQQLFSKGEAVNAVVLRNAEGGSGRGLEVDIQFHLNDNLVVAAGYGYADTEYEGPTFVTNPVVGVDTDIDGNPFIFAPEHTGNFSIDYSLPLGDDGELFFATDWSYRSENYFTVYKAEVFKGDGYWEGGLRCGYRAGGGRTEFAAWGRNLTDVEEALSNLTFTGAKVFTGPRTYGIDVITRF